ncbi:MAG: manganese efflux pump MntP family protein [Candidatus Delongbacteria bacterium]|jgi:putative Mn2+ efflux pump MntP|nr:manganese efflux pump MntP family protein [Candidatus Delongbacteria bacterium]
MNQLEIIILALALSADAFTVSISSGVCVKHIKFTQSIKMALFFGFFQGIMPIIGWFAGSTFHYYLKNYGKWIALALLAGIGIKMIVESFDHENEECKDYFNNRILFILAIATSIDALAAGLSLKFMDIDIFIPAGIIGLITFFMSLIGITVGKLAGNKLGRSSEVAGGLILIWIGIRLVIF